jgi:very-short-patch-repair endonuclease
VEQRRERIVTRQFVEPVKQQRSKEMRQRPTLAERRLWRVLRKGQVSGYRFRRQQVISGFIVDFYCHALRLVIEVDGPVHDDSIRADRERDDVLCGLGLRVLRFSNDAISNDLARVLAEIHATLAEVKTPSPSGEGAGGEV